MILEASCPLDADRALGAPSIHRDIGKDLPAHGEVFRKPDNAGLWRKADAQNRFDDFQATQLVDVY